MRGKRIEDEETKVALGMAEIGGVKDSVVWHRAYGTEHYPTNTERTTACTLLSRTLDKINEVEGIPVKRLVVGHTPQMQGAELRMRRKDLESGRWHVFRCSGREPASVGDYR